MSGRTSVGFLNDQFAAAHGELAIRYSLVVAASIGGMASLSFALSARTLREDLDAVTGR